MYLYTTEFMWQVEADLPVGQNLQDHLTTMLGPFIVDKPWTFLPTELLRYLAHQMTTMLRPFKEDKPKPWTFLPTKLLRYQAHQLTTTLGPFIIDTSYAPSFPPKLGGVTLKSNIKL